MRFAMRQKQAIVVSPCADSISDRAHARMTVCLGFLKATKCKLHEAIDRPAGAFGPTLEETNFSCSTVVPNDYEQS